MKLSYTLLAATALTFKGISTPHASDLMSTVTNVGASAVKTIITTTWEAGNHRAPATWFAQPTHRRAGE